MRLLRVEAEPAVFAPLVSAMTAAGLRCGWLDLTEPAPPPPALEEAAGLGMLRAVSAVGNRAVAVKPVKGGFVLRDLLREHFRGCALVLVRGDIEAAALSFTEGGWMVRTAGSEEILSTEELIARVRKPDWPPSLP